jgi:hypothetical protein
MAKMAEIIDGHATYIEPNLAWLDRNELFLLACKSVVDLEHFVFHEIWRRAGIDHKKGRHRQVRPVPFGTGFDFGEARVIGRTLCFSARISGLREPF